MSIAELLRVRLPCEPNAAQRAREALAGVEDVGSIRDEALLVVSELATNAVLHSGCSAEDEFELRAERRDAAVRITVTDLGVSGDRPVRRPHDPTTPGGMGLRVVERLAARWGTRRNHSLAVWAELPLVPD